MSYSDLLKSLVSGLAVIFLIVAFFYSLGWLVSHMQPEPLSCEEFPKYRYDDGTVPAKCYEKGQLLEPTTHQ